jgi:hypothetical protein
MAYKVWYMRPEFFRDGNMGADWLVEKGKLPDPDNLSATHIELCTSHESALNQVFWKMQAEVWNKKGHANKLIESKGLTHTSMSVGDVGVDMETGDAYMVDRLGFARLHPKKKPVAPSAKQRKSAINKRVADRIDGYDRDDLGESPDF